MIEIKNRYTGAVICGVYANNLSGANLSGADLSGADLRGANLRGANLISANLYSANLSGANLYSANLSGANLSGANLYSADLRGANLRGANLSGANLRGANLYSANLYSANLYSANLYSANLRGAKYGENTLLKFLSVGPIGSRKDYLQIFITDGPTVCCTGCFTGSPDELAARLTDTPEHMEYRAALAMINAMEQIYRPTTQEVTTP
jgi:hypothetical protein